VSESRISTAREAFAAARQSLAARPEPCGKGRPNGPCARKAATTAVAPARDYPPGLGPIEATICEAPPRSVGADSEPSRSSYRSNGHRTASMRRGKSLRHRSPFRARDRNPLTDIRRANAEGRHSRCRPCAIGIANLQVTTSTAGRVRSRPACRSSGGYNQEHSSQAAATLAKRARPASDLDLLQ